MTHKVLAPAGPAGAVRWLPVLLLLLVPSVPAQGGVLEVTLTDFTFDVAPETWKSRAPTEETAPYDLGFWGASLGLHLDVTLDLLRGGTKTGSTWTYEVTLSDGAVRVPGYVDVVGPGKLEVRFDVDGQRAHSGQSAVPELAAGTWTLHVRASQGDRHEGTGTTTLTTRSLAFEGTGAPGLALPEHLVPHVQELGPGPNTWMPLESVPGAVFPATFRLDGAAELHFDLWLAISGVDTPLGLLDLPVPDLPDPIALTPVAGNSPTNAATAWFQVELGSADALDEVQALLPTPNGTALAIYTVHTDQGGMVDFVVPVQGAPVNVQQILATPGSEGPVQISVQAPIDGPLANLHVISQDVPATMGNELGGRHLTSGLLLPAGEDQWQGGYDGTATRSAAVPAVAVVGFFQDANGGYAGHAAALRGVDARFDAATLGQGEDGELDLILAHVHPLRDAGLSLPLLADVSFAGTQFESAMLELAAAGELQRSHPIRPAAAGAFPAQAIIDTGDLRFTVDQSLDVLDPEAYEDATAPWYDVPGPGLAAVLVGLAFLALRKREI